MRTSKLLAAATIVFLSTLACTRVAYRPLLPAQVADWKMVANSLSCASAIPPNLNLSPDTAKARQVCTAQYVGNPNIAVTVYAMPDSSAAFEAVQHWSQPQSGKGAFYQDNLFVIVESPSTDIPTLARFSNPLKSTLAGQQHN